MTSIDLIRGAVMILMAIDHVRRLLYLVFGVAVVLLYFPCRWFAGLKARRKDWWLRYL